MTQTTTQKIKKEAKKFYKTGDSDFDFVSYADCMASLLERAKNGAGMSIDYWRVWLADFETFQRGEK